MEDLSQDIYVPQNYSNTDGIRGTNLLNVVEGGIITAIFSLLIFKTTLVIELKIPLCLIVLIALILAEIKYSKDYTLLTYLFHYIKWKNESKKYRLANVSEIKAKKNFDAKQSIEDVKKGFANVKQEVEKKFRK